MAFETAEQAMDWVRTLPPRVHGIVRNECARQYMDQVQWPEGEGFGSSDGWQAMRMILTEIDDAEIKEWEAMAQLVARLPEDFDFTAASRLFA